MFSAEPVDGFTIKGIVKEHVYVGSVLKTIVGLANGADIRLERLAGQSLPEGGTAYLYWDIEDAKIIHSYDQVIYEAVDNVQLG